MSENAVLFFLGLVLGALVLYRVREALPEGGFRVPASVETNEAAPVRRGVLYWLRGV